MPDVPIFALLVKHNSAILFVGGAIYRICRGRRKNLGYAWLDTRAWNFAEYCLASTDGYRYCMYRFCSVILSDFYSKDVSKEGSW